MSAPTAAELEATVAELLERDEREQLRAEYRAGGGSRRRPLKSFPTKAEKRAAREQHSERIAAACGRLSGSDGFSDWVAALILNPDLSALNCALVAGAERQCFGTAAQWRKRGGYSVRKGETAAAYVTAPGFTPKAAFTAEQCDATDLLELLEANPPRLPAAAELERLQAELERRTAAGGKPSRAVAELGAELRDAGALADCDGDEIGPRSGVSDEIPF